MLRSRGRPSAQAQLQKAKLVQALEAVDRLYRSDRRDSLRQAVQRLRPVAGAAPRDRGFASSIGGEGGAAQLLHLAQRPPRSAASEVCRSDGMVSSQFTPSV